MSDAGALEVRLEARVLWLTIARPAAANALTRDLARRLIAQFERAGGDAEVGAVVLTAAGSRVFCAGADLKEFSELPTAEAASIRRWVLVDLFAALAACEKPVLVAVQGKAVGAGAFLCALADQVLACSESEFSIPEVRMGIATPVGVTIMANRMPRALVIRHVLRSEPMSAAAAAAAGLVDAVVPADELVPRAAAAAARLAQLSGHSYAATKRWLNAGLRAAIIAAANEAQRLQDAQAPHRRTTREENHAT